MSISRANANAAGANSGNEEHREASEPHFSCWYHTITTPHKALLKPYHFAASLTISESLHSLEFLSLSLSLIDCNCQHAQALQALLLPLRRTPPRRGASPRRSCSTFLLLHFFGIFHLSRVCFSLCISVSIWLINNLSYSVLAWVANTFRAQFPFSFFFSFLFLCILLLIMQSLSFSFFLILFSVVWK